MPVRLKQMDSSAGRTLVLRFNVPNAVTMVRVALAIVVAWLLIQRGADVPYDYPHLTCRLLLS